jgi:acetyl esterase/lipase
MIKFHRLLFITTLMIMNTASAQTIIPLYPEKTGLRIWGRQKLTDAPHLVHHPLPGDRTGKPCVLICPGGGYTNLAAIHEGKDVAAFFNSMGYEAFVLMYRLNDGEQAGSRFPAQHEDVTTAMRIIKSRAADLGVDPNKTGILGFSAGGHLASMGATMHKEADPAASDPLARYSSRPSFAILIYPVISLKDSFAHKYSAEMLTGKEPNPALRDSLSTYNRVTSQTPPTFIVFSSDDKSVPVQNGIVFYQALLQNGVKASLHVFDHGGHGYGMGPKDPVLNQWPGMAVRWLESQGMR